MWSLGKDCSFCEFKLVKFGFNIVRLAILDPSGLSQD